MWCRPVVEMARPIPPWTAKPSRTGRDIQQMFAARSEVSSGFDRRVRQGLLGATKDERPLHAPPHTSLPQQFFGGDRVLKDLKRDGKRENSGLPVQTTIPR